MDNRRKICSTPIGAEVLNTGGSNSAQAAAMFAWLQDAVKDVSVLYASIHLASFFQNLFCFSL